MKEFSGLRRSLSERRLHMKGRKERKEKARSVHFGDDSAGFVTRKFSKILTFLTFWIRRET